MGKKAVSNTIINWKTTLTGVIAFLAMLFAQLNFAFDADPATVPDWNVVVAAAMIMLGLTQARDADKSSEQQRH